MLSIGILGVRVILYGQYLQSKILITIYGQKTYSKNFIARVIKLKDALKKLLLAIYSKGLQIKMLFLLTLGLKHFMSMH